MGSTGRGPGMRHPAAVYRYPLYYEIAFSFRDIPREVTVMREAHRRFGRGELRRVLELGCGPAAHLVEWAWRGVHYTGIDLSDEMVAFARKRAEGEGCSADFQTADMCGFELRGPRADFAYVLIGSLYAPDEEALDAHFECVARSLRPGALYLLHWCVHFERGLDQAPTSWEMERDGITVAYWYATRRVYPGRNVVEETMRMDIDDHGIQSECEDSCLRCLLPPQEFRKVIESNPAFEFLGWWREWDLESPIPPDRRAGGESISDPIVILRRV